jgi:endonuclease V-like protein UPF0215 family
MKMYGTFVKIATGRVIILKSITERGFQYVDWIKLTMDKDDR